MNQLVVGLFATLKDNPDALMFALLLAFLGYLATLAATAVRRASDTVARGAPTRPDRFIQAAPDRAAS